MALIIYDLTTNGPDRRWYDPATQREEMARHVTAPACLLPNLDYATSVQDSVQVGWGHGGFLGCDNESGRWKVQGRFNDAEIEACKERERWVDEFRRKENADNPIPLVWFGFPNVNYPSTHRDLDSWCGIRAHSELIQKSGATSVTRYFWDTGDLDRWITGTSYNIKLAKTIFPGLPCYVWMAQKVWGKDEYDMVSSEMFGTGLQVCAQAGADGVLVYGEVQLDDQGVPVWTPEAQRIMGQRPGRDGGGR